MSKTNETAFILVKNCADRYNAAMAQMNISIPDGLKAWVESRIAEGRYASVSDYVRDLVRRDQDSESELGWLNEAIAEGLASPPSDRSVGEIIAEHRKTLG